MDTKILIADDDAMLRQLLCDIVAKEGYLPVEASDGQAALDAFFSEKRVELVILDVMMPVRDGWSVLKEIRQRSDVPILMLTALGDEQHEVSGLSHGADDYISKPFSYRILTARIRALLRKSRGEQLLPIRAGELTLDAATRRAYAGSHEIVLNHKEFELLLHLVRNRGLVLERKRILNAVWGYEYDGDIRTIDAHVKMLRGKLLQCSDYIRTARGIGYVFEVPDATDD